MKNAEAGITRLKENVDTLIIIPNDRLLDLVDRRTSVTDAFKIADEVLQQAVQGITDLINKPGLINLDFADISSVMKEKGLAHFGIGYAKGDEKAMEAVQKAVTSPLLETSIRGASDIIVNVSGDISLLEATEASDYVRDMVGDAVNFIFGVMPDETMSDECVITVIATGLENPEELKTTSAFPNLQYTSTTTSNIGKVAPSMSSRPTPTVSASTTSAAKTFSNTSAAVNTVNATMASNTVNNAGGFSGLQKPQQPSSSVAEQDIRIPDFLKSSKK